MAVKVKCFKMSKTMLQEQRSKQGHTNISVPPGNYVCLCLLAYNGKSTYQCCGSALVSVRIRIQHFRSTWIQIPHFRIWFIFALLDLNPDPADQINANPDPDPYHWCINILLWAAWVLFWNPAVRLSCCSLSFLFLLHAFMLWSMVIQLHAFCCGHTYNRRRSLFLHASTLWI